MGAGGTLIGVFIGLVLGLGLAAGVAYYLMKSNGPFPAQGGRETRDGMKEPAKVAKADAGNRQAALRFLQDPARLRGAESAGRCAQGQGTHARPRRRRQSRDRTAPDKAVVAKAPEKVPEKAPEPAPAAKAAERFWLQAGSFGTEADAENLKARLAFAGWQAIVQQGAVPDKGTRYRVRLGPYDNTDELNRIRNDLSKNGFDVAVIKY